MPHPRCSVCRHESLDAITAALKAGESVRVLARRFGLSPAAVNRHQHEEDRDRSRINTGQIAKIDEEIKKLIRAQNRAKKKRDSAGALAIARELRNWFVLRQKAEIAAIGTASENENSAEMPLRDAIGMAKSLIESQLADPDVRSWLVATAERVRATGNVPDSQE